MCVYYLGNPEVVLREEDEDGALLFNPDNNRICILNPTGLFIWKLCDGAHDLSAVIQCLKIGFIKTPESDVLYHVVAFLEDLKSNGFINVL